jgi:hypothetical protein
LFTLLTPGPNDLGIYPQVLFNHPVFAARRTRSSHALWENQVVAPQVVFSRRAWDDVAEELPPKHHKKTIW